MDDPSKSTIVGQALRLAEGAVNSGVGFLEAALKGDLADPTSQVCQ